MSKQDDELLGITGERGTMTAERELELLNELTWSDICAGYSARELWESLVERIGERMDTEEMEMRVILDEIAERLEERESVLFQIEASARAALSARHPA